VKPEVVKTPTPIMLATTSTIAEGSPSLRSGFELSIEESEGKCRAWLVRG